MKQQKMEWEIPELIVLVRSKPEEAVLTACKGNTDGPADGYGARCLASCGTGGPCNAEALS